MDDHLRKSSINDIFNSCVDKIVNESKNSDLARAVLFRVDLEGGDVKLTDLTKKLETDESKIKDIVDYFLDFEVLITKRSVFSGKDEMSFYLNPRINSYLSSDLPYGARKLFEKDGIETERIISLISKAFSFIRFRYFKRFELPQKKLDNTKKVISHSLDALIEEERKLFCAELQIPEAYAGATPSFFAKSKEIFSYGGETTIINLEGRFDSFYEAIRMGFDSAEGGLKLSRRYKVFLTGLDNSQEKHFIDKVVRINQTNETYGLEVKNPRYLAIHGTFEFQQEVGILTENMKEKIHEVISMDNSVDHAT